MNYDKQLAIIEIKNHGLRYVDFGEDSIIVTIPSKHIGAYEFLLSFSKTGQLSTIVCLCRIANIKEHYLGLHLCNELNSEYRWTRFFIDEDDCLFCQVDAFLDQGNFSNSLFSHLYIFTSNIDSNFSKISECSSENLY